MRGIARTLRMVLDRLDQVADQEIDRIAAPERLADTAEIIRTDLTECLDAYFRRAPAAPPDTAARELATQLEMIGVRADRLAAQVPDSDARRAEDLTREMRRRHER